MHAAVEREVDAAVLHRGIDELLDRRGQPVDLVDEEDITRLHLGERAHEVARLHHAGARRDHHLQRLALVPGVALHGLHEIGDEVVPPLELDVDAGPALLHELREAGEAVVGGDEPDERQADDDRRHAARGAETS